MNDSIVAAFIAIMGIAVLVNAATGHTAIGTIATSCCIGLSILSGIYWFIRS